MQNGDMWLQINQDVADLQSTNTLSDERVHMNGLDDSKFVWPEPECEITGCVSSIWVVGYDEIGHL